MGHPRKIRSKYQGPTHPWRADRLERERQLLKTYGLKNKKELWKAESKLRKWKHDAKRLIPTTGPQTDKERHQLLHSLHTLGLINDNATLETILDLTLEDLLKRRLQTMILTHNLATTTRQARQLIVHKHITVNNKKINIPSYHLRRGEEHTLAYATNSPLTTPDHPQRTTITTHTTQHQPTPPPQKPTTT